MVKAEEFNALCERVNALEKLLARVAELEKLNKAKDEKIKNLEEELKMEQTLLTGAISSKQTQKNPLRKST